MPMSKPGPLDALLGDRIRILRVDRGVSQSALAERIGVSFQQVQKYERGIDRVGATRLSQIASVLNVSVAEFFESSRGGSPRLTLPIRLLAEPSGLPFRKAHARMRGLRIRTSIVKLIGSIADRNSAAKATVARPNTGSLGERRKFPSRR